MNNNITVAGQVYGEVEILLGDIALTSATAEVRISTYDSRSSGDMVIGSRRPNRWPSSDFDGYNPGQASVIQSA